MGSEKSFDCDNYLLDAKKEISSAFSVHSFIETVNEFLDPFVGLLLFLSHIVI